LSYSALNNIVTLKFGLQVTQGTIRKLGYGFLLHSTVKLWLYLV